VSNWLLAFDGKVLEAFGFRN